MYQLTESGVLKIDENMYIPSEPLNKDWQEYLAWVSKGNVPNPIPGPTEEEVMRYNIDKRNSMLSRTDWIVTRHRDQIDANLATSYNEKQYEMVLNWRQALRDMDFTIEVKPPEKPDTPKPDTPKPDIDKPSTEPTLDTLSDDSNLNEPVTPPNQSTVEHAQMVRQSLDNQPTLFVTWPSMPDFMEGMFDDYPPKELGTVKHMGY